MQQTSINPPSFRKTKNTNSRFASPLVRAVVLGSAVVALTTSVSQAVVRLTFEMRAVQTGLNAADVSNGANISPDGLSVQLQPGGSVVLQLVATLNETNGILTDDSITRVDGSFVSFGTIGALTGSLRSSASTTAGPNNVDPFAAGVGAKSGTPLELSGTAISGGVADNILDAGGNSTSAYTGYFTASGPVAGQLGKTFILGETILTLNGAGSTSVRYIPRTGVGGLAGNRVAATFRIDTVAYSLNGDGSGTGGGADAFSFGTPLSIIAVPEPSAFGMVLLGSLGVIGFRRFGLRKS